MTGFVGPAAPRASVVPSPCISVCRMDAQGGHCLGCLRTIDEIAAWSRLGDDAKRAVWQLIEQRQAVSSGTDQQPSE